MKPGSKNMQKRRKCNKVALVRVLNQRNKENKMKRTNDF